MVRKFVLLIFVICCVVLPLSSHESEYYPVSSEEWRLVDDICRLSGVTGPSSFGPVTGRQLLLALERAEKKGASPSLLEKARGMIYAYDGLYEDDLGSIALEVELNLEGYYQTNGDELTVPSFGYDNEWFVRNYRERPSTLAMKLESTVGDYFYSRFVMPAREKQIMKEFYWNDSFHFLGQSMVMEQNYPYDAGVSFSSNNLSLITGRGKVSQGEGFTGNTAVGDNYDYQEFLKLGANTRNTGLFLTLTNFDSSRQAIADSGHLVTEPWKVQNAKFSGYRELRHSAGYEASIFDKVKVSLSFVTLLDTDTAFDFRYLNPFMVMHSYFNYHEDTVLEANNIISLDLSFAIAKGLRLYFQFSMDQIQFSGEAKGYANDYLYVDPNAYAALLNISWSKDIEDGILTLFGEAVYTSPAMYLNQKYYDSEGNVTQYKGKIENGQYTSSFEPCWSQDFLLGYNRTESYGYNADMAFSGYIYGPDAIVFALGGEYYIPEKIKISSSIFYMMHGEKGRGFSIENYNFSGLDTLETINVMSPTGVVEHTLVAKVEGDYIINDYVSIYGGAAFSSFWNYRNVEGKDFTNLQTALGVKLKYSL